MSQPARQERSNQESYIDGDGLTFPKNFSLTHLADKFSIDQIIAQVLILRGIDKEEDIRDFLKPVEEITLPDPSVIKGVDKAFNLIYQAMQEKKPIAICCDYDSDGANSAAQFLHFLKKLGVKHYLMPTDRFRGGYGLQNSIIDTAKKRGCGLLITVDIGTSNHKEISYAKQQGLNVIVIDHHKINQEYGIPPADAFINPLQQGCGFGNGSLCAAALTWFVIWELKNKLEDKNIEKAKEFNPSPYLLLAAIATITDMMPLKGLNRDIVKLALSQSYKSSFPGLEELKKLAGISGSITAEDIAFKIGPILNAAGRIIKDKKHPGVFYAIELLCAKNKPKRERLAKELYEINQQRKEQERKDFLLIKKKIDNDLKVKKSPALVIAEEGLSSGTLGIVASRLMRLYEKPVIVLAQNKESDLLVGSARSIPNLDITAILAKKDIALLLERFGGHKGAAGLSLKRENLEKFKNLFTQYVEEEIKKLSENPFKIYDLELTNIPSEEHLHRLYEDLLKLAPFGQDNPPVRFLIKNLLIISILQENALLKMRVRIRDDDNSQIAPAYIWHNQSQQELKPTDVISAIVSLQRDRRYYNNPRKNSIYFNIERLI